MKTYKLRTLLFLTMCCDLGLFAKKLINPVANVITDSLHIPGGISTGFSLMFLVIAALLANRPGCAALMGLVQSGIALAIGMVGSMGALAPIGYVMPGIAIDLAGWITGKYGMARRGRSVIMNGASSVCAAFTANCIVFHLRGTVLLLYLYVAAVSGALCGLLGATIARRVMPALGGKL